MEENIEIKTTAPVTEDKNRFRFAELKFGKILTDLLKIDTITNINCWYDNIIITDNTRSENYRYDFSQNSEEEIQEYRAAIMRIPENLAHRMEKPFTPSEPSLDAENSDDEAIGRLRVNAIYPEVVSSDGTRKPAVSIRKTLMKVRLTEDNILSSGYASKEIHNLLEVLIKAKCNAIFTGRTNAGKTEALRYFSRYLTGNIITIEDTREAYLKYNYPEKDVLEIKAEPDMFSYWIKNALRQHPQYIMVSEARGEEVLDLIDAAETDHHVLTTIHTSRASFIPNRIVDMSKTIGTDAVRLYKQVFQNIDLGIYIQFVGNKRKISQIVEFYYDEDNDKTITHSICKYDLSQKRYVYEKIQSPKIIENILTYDIDSSKIDGVFL